MKFALTLALTLALVASGSRSTDEQQVRGLLAAAEKSAQARDAGDVLARVADDDDDSNGFDKTRLRNFLRAWFVVHGEWRVVRADRTER